MKLLRYMIFTLCLVATLSILSGCRASIEQTQSVGNPSAGASSQVTMNKLKKALISGSEKFPAWIQLPSGAFFVFWNRGYDNLFNEYQLVNAVFQAVDGELQTKIVFLFDDNVQTRIFYREDWEKHSGIVYPSSFQYYTNPLNDKVDILIAVGQNYEDNQSFSDAEDGLAPEDTLGTKALKYQQKGWNNGYPLWIFAIPLEKIEESYELHFGDYVLTGNDILNHSWKIGNAEPLIYGHVVVD